MANAKKLGPVTADHHLVMTDNRTHTCLPAPFLIIKIDTNQTETIVEFSPLSK
jgi:hypothetical protein